MGLCQSTSVDTWTGWQQFSSVQFSSEEATVPAPTLAITPASSLGFYFSLNSFSQSFSPLHSCCSTLHCGRKNLTPTHPVWNSNIQFCWGNLYVILGKALMKQRHCLGAGSFPSSASPSPKDHPIVLLIQSRKFSTKSLREYTHELFGHDILEGSKKIGQEPLCLLLYLSSCCNTPALGEGRKRKDN